MKKIYSLLVICLFALSSKVNAQTFPVPENYTLKVKEDYAKYEQDIVNTVDWLQQAPWGEQDDKIKQANTFLIAWITGSPNVTIEVGSPLMKLVDKNKDLLVTFMGGYTKYCLQHKDDKNKANANAAALRALINKYQMEKNHVKDKAVEKLIQLDKDGKLDAWAATEYIKA
jgi:hypothetical protein